MKHFATLLLSLLIAAAAAADDGKPPSTGLSVMVNAGGFWADKVTANFYSGRPGNSNTIDRILKSNTYGQDIWYNLRDQQLITSAVGSYTQLRVAEYPDMYYRTSYQVGLGLHYGYKSGFGWLLHFDIARLTALGAFNLDATGGTGQLGRDQYVRCGMMGREDRINIDLAITKTVALTRTLDLEVDVGASLISSEVRENLMEIAGKTYSILDVWDGRSPDYGVGEYNYMNQGGIGYGAFASLLIGYSVPTMGSFKVGYTCYYNKTILKGYDAWGWQHMLGIRVEMNNFSFIK